METRIRQKYGRLGNEFRLFLVAIENYSFQTTQESESHRSGQHRIGFEFVE